LISTFLFICLSSRNLNIHLSDLCVSVISRGEQVTFRWWPDIYTMIYHWNNISWVDMSLHSDTLSWFRTKQSFFILLKHACRVEKQQIPILQSLVWPNLGSNTRFYRTEDKQVNQYITDAVLTHMSWLHTLYKVVDPLIVSVCQLIAGMIPMWTSAFLFPLLVGISEWDRKFQTFQRTCSPCWFYLNLCCPSSSLDLGTLCLSSDVGTWCSSSDMDTSCSSVVSCVCLRSPVFVCEREYCSSSDMDTPVFVVGTCGSS
jgi:hypothetical protein